MSVRVLAIRVLASCAVILATGVPVFAQRPVFEAQVGVAWSTVPDLPEAVFDPMLEIGYRTGLIAGGGIEVPFGAQFVFRPAAVFTQKGVTLRGGSENIPEGSSVKVDFVEVPFLFAARWVAGASAKPYVTAGPTIGFRTRASMSAAAFGRTGPDVDLASDFRRTELGVALGGGIEWARLRLEGRYTWGLTDLVKADAPLRDREMGAVTTNTIGVLVAVRF